jgi:hypothetical protein
MIPRPINSHLYLAKILMSVDSGFDVVACGLYREPPLRFICRTEFINGALYCSAGFKLNEEVDRSEAIDELGPKKISALVSGLN